jgi:large subunit ribosomal protein L10
MAISKAKKQTLVAELNEILADAKMAVFAQYSGVSVKEMQELRRAARAQGVTIKVVKNRLVRVAMSQTESLKNIDASALRGQVLYAFSDADEVVPAKVLAEFAKNYPALQLVGAFSGEGATLDTAETTALAALPSKNDLIAQVIATLQSPVNDVVGALNPLGQLVNALEAKAS